MSRRTYRYVACAVAGIACLGAVPVGAQEPDDSASVELAPATHDRPPVSVIATGLNGPLELRPGRGGGFLVTEAADGQVTRVGRDGEVEVLLDGIAGAAGADFDGGKLYVLTGGGGPEEGEEGTDAPPPPPPTYPPASLLVARSNGTRTRVLADLMAYELAANPDGQLQFDPETGQPNDALSNPFYVLARRTGNGVFVADGGANAVLLVTSGGTVSTFFAPPTVNTGACAGRPNNSPATPGCDSVPTGIAYGPDGSLYVSALTGEAPGEGRVYRINGRTGALLGTVSGFTSPTGVAVGRDGTLYVSEALHGAPEGEPPADFDPATIGRIVRVAPDGTRTAAAVTQPTGLLMHNGKLYASAWSLAALFLGIQDAGQIVQVNPSAFTNPV